MRQADADEVLASDGMTPSEALWASIQNSDECSTFLINGQVAAIFGAVVIREDFLGPPLCAQAWMLTSDVVDRYPILFARVSMAVAHMMAEKYGCLLNAVDARYGAALRWAEWVGFEVSEPRPWGKSGKPFCSIEMRR